VWPGHGAGSACGKSLGAIPQSTVGYEKAYNGAIDAARRGQQAFVATILDAQPEPPLYFARMKAQNRDGVPPLDGLPVPRALAPDELADLGAAGLGDAAVVDTRADRSAFMAAHLPGSLYAPFTKQFNTAVGSYVTDPETPVVLLIDEAKVSEAVRDLVRIGLDRVVAYATPATLAAVLQRDGAAASIREVGFEAVVEREEGAAVLDVRRQAEFEGGHVPGATNIAHTRLADRLDEVPSGSPLYVHCQSGVRSAVASALLAAEGRDVVYVNDGFPHYREIGEVAEGAPADVNA
jgi:hydroxyacylglutathione hydrolase